MAPSNLSRFACLAAFFVVIPHVVAQTVSPDPVFDCTNPNFRVIYTACKAGDYSRCCAAGTSCCAGGCCDLLSNCLNVGTSNEVCCPATDPTICGYGSGTGTAPFAVQSVVCTGSDGLSSYFCPPGATCNTSRDSCIGGSSAGGSGNSGGSSSSSVVIVSSTSTSSSIRQPTSTSMEQVTPSDSSLQSSSLEPSSTTEAADNNQATTVTVTPGPSVSSTQTGGASHSKFTTNGISIFVVAFIVGLSLAYLLDCNG